MNKKFDWDLYFSQLKKKLNRGTEFLAKIRNFTSLIEFKKIEKLQEKVKTDV